MTVLHWLALTSPGDVLTAGGLFVAAATFQVGNRQRRAAQASRVRIERIKIRAIGGFNAAGENIVAPEQEVHLFNDSDDAIRVPVLMLRSYRFPNVRRLLRRPSPVPHSAQWLRVLPDDLVKGLWKTDIDDVRPALLVSPAITFGSACSLTQETTSQSCSKTLRGSSGAAIL